VWELLILSWAERSWVSVDAISVNRTDALHHSVTMGVSTGKVCWSRCWVICDLLCEVWPSYAWLIWAMTVGMLSKRKKKQRKGGLVRDRRRGIRRRQASSDRLHVLYSWQALRRSRWRQCLVYVRCFVGAIPLSARKKKKEGRENPLS